MLYLQFICWLNTLVLELQNTTKQCDSVSSNINQKCVISLNAMEVMRTHLSNITAKLKVEFKGIFQYEMKFFSFRNSAFSVLPWTTQKKISLQFWKALDI